MESTKKEEISRRKLVLKFGGKYIITSLVILLFVFTLSLFDYSSRIIFLNTLHVNYIDTIISWVLFITGLIVSILVVNRMISSIFDKYKLKKTDIFALMFISFISFIICFSILKIFLHISEMNYMRYMDYWNKEAYSIILKVTSYVVFIVNLLFLMGKILEDTETSESHKVQNNGDNKNDLEKIRFGKLLLKFLGEYIRTSFIVTISVLAFCGIWILIPIVVLLIIIAKKKKWKIDFQDTLNKYIIKRKDLKKITLLIIPFTVMWATITCGLIYYLLSFLYSGYSDPLAVLSLAINVFIIGCINITTIIALSLLLIIKFAKILKKTKGKEYINSEK